MTMPETLHAVTALWSLRKAVEVYLPDIADAKTIQRPDRRVDSATRARPKAVLIGWDKLLRIERAERIVADRQDIHQMGASPVPLDLALVDAETAAGQAMIDAAWLTASALRRRPLLVYGEAWHVIDRGRWSGRARYLTIALPHVTDPATALEVAALLAGADQQVRAACRAGVDQVQIPGNPPCPACGVRLLRINCAAPDSAAWTITCNGRCRCAGATSCPGTADPDACDCADEHEPKIIVCPCDMTHLVPGVRHIWDATSELAAVARALAEHGPVRPAVAA